MASWMVWATMALPIQLLNQARAGHRPVCAWFLKNDPCGSSVCVLVCVCVSAPKATKIYWHDVV